MEDKERKENFRKISDDLVLPLMLRPHCVSASYERNFDGYSTNNVPTTYLHGTGDQITLKLAFNPDTCQEGKFYFDASFPDECDVVKRSDVISDLSKRIKETPFEFEAEEHQVSVSGDFTSSNVEEVSATLLSVDDAVRALYNGEQNA